jgi:Domain of unknown function (DUF3332)
MGTRRFGRAVALFLALSFGIVSAGCYGKFQLTRNLYQINQSVDDNYARSVLTWVLIVPYAFTGILDFAVFNVIEFWSGENPIASGPLTRETAMGTGKAVLELSREGEAITATITRYERGSAVTAVRFRDDGSGTVTAVETVAGLTIRTITATRRDDGSVAMTVTASGVATTSTIAASAMRSQAERIARIAASAHRSPRQGGGPVPLAAAPAVPAFGG